MHDENLLPSTIKIGEGSDPVQILPETSTDNRKAEAETVERENGNFDEPLGMVIDDFKFWTWWSTMIKRL